MTATTHPARLTRSPATLLRLASDHAPLLAVAGLFACALFAYLPAEMSPDGWYAFLGGDVIVHHGLPTHDTLTVWGAGRRWVDQQWLAQLLSYGLYALGGLRLALLVNAAVVAGSFAGAVALARRRGGDARAVVYVSVVGAVAVGFSSFALRPQTLALPLFVAVAWLLVSDGRRPSRRVFLTIPLLLLWANLHGSVTLGVLLVLVAAATGMWSARSLQLRRLGLAAVALLTPFASPYAPHLAGYYRTILFNRQFARYLPDWMPTALTPRTLAFYLLACGALLALARAPRTVTLFERVTLVLLLVLGIEASRGVTWFSFFAVIVVPTAATSLALPAPRRLPERARAAVALAAMTAATTALVAGVVRPDSGLSSNYPPSAARAAVAAAGPRANVFANGAYADWLLLAEPSLRGRVAYDARFELMPKGRLSDAVAVSIARWDAERILLPYDVLVLRPEEAELRDTLLRSGDWERVPTAQKVVLLRRIAG